MIVEQRPPSETMIDVLGRLVSGERVVRQGREWIALPGESVVAGVVVAGLLRRKLARIGKPVQRDFPELILNSEGREFIESLWAGEPQP